MKKSDPSAILSLDAGEKNHFDMIQWKFIFTALTKLGPPLCFIKWITILYDRPKSNVMTNGHIAP